MSRNRVRQPLVGGDQLRPRFDCQGDVEAVINRAVETGGDLERVLDQALRRNCRQIQVLYRRQIDIRVGAGASAPPNSFPQDVAELGPKQVGDDELDLAPVVAAKQGNRFLDQSLVLE